MARPDPLSRLARAVAGLLAAGALCAAWAVVGDVRTWMPAGTATSWLKSDGSLWIASTRGVYLYDTLSRPSFRRRFGPADGLPGADVALLGVNEGRLRAVMASGAVARFDPNRNRFEAVNSSWQAENLPIEPGVGCARGRYLVFASGGKVALYDTRTERTELTLSHLSSSKLTRAVASKGALTLVFEDARFRAPFDWDSLLATRDASGRKVNLSDPSQWRALPADSVPAPDSALGKRVRALALPGDDVEGIRSLLFSEDGTLHGWHEPLVRRLDADGNWGGAFRYDPGVAGTNYEVGSRWIRPWSAWSGGWLFGSWGKGALLSSADGASQRWLLPETPGSCLPAYEPLANPSQPSFAVVAGGAPLGDGAVFAVWPPAAEKGWLLVWWDGKNAPVCKPVEGMKEPQLLVPGREEGEFWATNVGSAQRLRLGSRLSSVEVEKTYPVESVGAVTGLAFDRLGRVWISGADGFGVICDENAPEGICSLGVPDTVARADYWLGLSEGNFSTVREDGHGRLWFASAVSGVVRVDVSGRDVPRSGIKRWTSANGLPSDEVFDVVVDPKSGLLYAATSAGVVRIETSSRDKKQFESGPGPVVYPNPFRPGRHSAVRFDRVPSGASVAVYSRSGRLVRKFSPSAAEGGLVEWDGRDASGRLLEPGVWNWVVSSSKKSWKGRLLVVR
ncbi:MAG: hypothetical protein J6Z50_03065 [Fibrobacterales bacterium]|nr:hypothetical protein [Fibrobacterales bacterium]